MNVITDPLFYPLAVIAVTALGLGKGGFAGVGVIATPLLATILPPLQAAAILLPILIVQDAISVWVYRHDWSAWHLKVMLPGGLLGIGIAWSLATQVSDAAVRLVIGLIGVAFALNAWLRPKSLEAKPRSVSAGVFWGTVAGFTSTLSQAGGPPFQVYVLPQRLPKLTQVGTYTIYFAVLNWLKIGPYFALGQFSTATLASSLLLLPVAVLANFLGIWLVRRTPTGLFYQIAYVLVFLISLELIRSGATTLVRG
ncbi:MAG TPA: sulfite exporter TauE/SafE family protein [Xanthobacteraceae bacterium]